MYSKVFLIPRPSCLSSLNERLKLGNDLLKLTLELGLCGFEEGWDLAHVVATLVDDVTEVALATTVPREDCDNVSLMVIG